MRLCILEFCLYCSEIPYSACSCRRWQSRVATSLVFYFFIFLQWVSARRLLTAWTCVVYSVFCVFHCPFDAALIICALFYCCTSCMLLNSQACPQPTALLLFTHTLTHTDEGSKCLLLLLRCESRLKFLLSGSLKWFCAALELGIFRECLEVPFIALIVPVLLRLLFLEMHTISFVILMSSIPLGLAKFRLVQTIYYSIDLGFYLKTLTRIKLKLRILCWSLIILSPENNFSYFYLWSRSVIFNFCKVSRIPASLQIIF